MPTSLAQDPVRTHLPVRDDIQARVTVLLPDILDRSPRRTT
jgi:hypothetical protein